MCCMVLLESYFFSLGEKCNSSSIALRTLAPTKDTSSIKPVNTDIYIRSLMGLEMSFKSLYVFGSSEKLSVHTHQYKSYP